MNYLSLSVAYRLGMGFHALNNEGADGSNLMQPRRIDVGSVTYDGISGEIIRHHILENFVDTCRMKDISMLPMSEGLHPDRGPLGIRAAAKALGLEELTNENLHASIREAIKSCAILDVGGYLAAWKEQSIDKYVAEKAYVDTQCIRHKEVDPVKRESCFDVAWLVSEAPQDLTVTQHSAYRTTYGLNSRYAQTMRSNIYGGVIRADLHRIGTDDYWYLQNGVSRLAVSEEEQQKRQIALIEAILTFIASPTGAKVAGWTPHVFLTEGVILLASGRTAPFVSPIKVCLNNQENPVSFNEAYAIKMQEIGNKADFWTWRFSDITELLEATQSIAAKVGGIE